MKKNIMLIGSSTCGKTTLCQRLNGLKIEYQKTQTIGVINNKTTAVRLIPVYGKGVGESVEFGGLLGHAPIMKLNEYSSEEFIKRGGRIPAPIHSLRN